MSPATLCAAAANRAVNHTGLTVTIVSACRRVDRGGSPTAVMDDAPLSDAQRCGLPARLGTSHAVFVSVEEGGIVALRFFTAEGELPACGHGTVAALALLAERAGTRTYRTTLRAPERTFFGQVVREGAELTATFDPGPVAIDAAPASDLVPILSALGLAPQSVAGDSCVASPGRPRLLVPVADPASLASLVPDFDALRHACDQSGLLGCYVYSVPDTGGRLSARMFAPSIGVPEDVANANSTACLAAHLVNQGIDRIAVDMGDSLDRPSTIVATARKAPSGAVIYVGGTAAITHTLLVT